MIFRRRLIRSSFNLAERACLIDSLSRKTLYNEELINKNKPINETAVGSRRIVKKVSTFMAFRREFTIKDFDSFNHLFISTRSLIQERVNSKIIEKIIARPPSKREECFISAFQLRSELKGTFQKKTQTRPPLKTASAIR